MALSLTEDAEVLPGRGLINVAVMAVVRAAAREETRVIRCVHEAHLHVSQVGAGRGRTMCGILQIGGESVEVLWAAVDHLQLAILWIKYVASVE